MNKRIGKFFLFGLLVMLLGFFYSCSDDITLFQQPTQQSVEDVTKIDFSVSMYDYADKIKLTWDAVDDAQVYWIYRFERATTIIGNNTPVFRVVNARQNAKEYNIDINLNKDEIPITQTYFFVVRAMVANEDRQDENIVIPMRNKAGYIIESDMKKGKNLGQVILSQSNDKFYAVTLRWDYVEGATRYVIKRKEKKEDAEDYTNIVTIDVGTDNTLTFTKYVNGEAIEPFIRRGSLIEYTDNNVIAENKYLYQIAAQNYDEDKVVAENIKEVTKVTPKQNGPYMVSNFQVSRYVTENNIQLTWDTPAPLDGFDSNTLAYQIYRRETSTDYAQKFVYIGKTNINETIYIDSNVQEGNLYEYQVVGFYEANGVLGVASNILEGVTLPKAQNVEVLLEYNLETQIKKIDVQWKSNIDVLEENIGPTGLPQDVHVQIVRRLSNIVPKVSKITDQQALEEQYFDEDELITGDYLYYVQFINTKENVEGSLSDAIAVRVFDIEEYNFDFQASKHLSNKVRFMWKKQANSNITSIQLQEFDISTKSFKDSEDFTNISESSKLDYYVVEKEKDSNPVLYRLKIMTNDVVLYTRTVIGQGLPAPQGVQASIGESKTLITVSWLEQLGVKGYYVETQNPGSSKWVRQQKTDSTGQVIIDETGHSTPLIVFPQTTFDVTKPTAVDEVSKRIQSDLEKIQTYEIITNRRLFYSFTPQNNDSSKHRGEKIKIRVKAISEDRSASPVLQQESPYGDVVVGNTFGPALLNVRVTQADYVDKVVVTWSKIEKATGYEIIRKKIGTTEEFSLAKVKVKSASVQEYTYEDLTVNPTYKNRFLEDPQLQLEDTFFTKYEYSVRPLQNGIVGGLFSIQVIGYTLGSPRYVDASQYESGRYIYIYWEPVPKANRYKIYESRNRNDDDFTILATVDAKSGDADKNDDYENTQVYRHAVGKNQRVFYKVVAERVKSSGTRIISKKPENYAQMGITIGIVTNVEASNRAKAIGYERDSRSWNTKDLYVAKHGATNAIANGNLYTYGKSSATDANNPTFKYNAAQKNYYATKITWSGVPRAQKYYIYRMDFNESSNFWRKIGERNSDTEGVFFDAESLILREHRALYWIVAVVTDRHGNEGFDESVATIKGKRAIYEGALTVPKQYSASDINSFLSKAGSQENIAIGSRALTPKEKSIWALYTVGRAARRLGRDNEFSNGDGQYKMDVWGKGAWGLDDLEIQIQNYSIGEFGKEDDYTHAMTVNTLVYDCGTANWYNCSGLVANGYSGDWGALGTYLGSDAGRYYSDEDGGYSKQLELHSPYGKFVMSIFNDIRADLGTAARKGHGDIWIDIVSDDDRYSSQKFGYDYKKKFDYVGLWFNKNDNNGTPSIHNPFFIGYHFFNSSYATSLQYVYGKASERESSALK